MKKMDDVKYGNLSYNKYKEKIDSLFKNEKMKSLGIKKIPSSKTSYGYDLDCFSVGNGNKTIFIVGGTHGSEIISVDFVLQLAENIPNIKEFDPNKVKLVFFPLQNPEGFDISSSYIKDYSVKKFNKKAYEYYLRYRTDDIINKAMVKISELLQEILNLSPDTSLNKLKNFINNSEEWEKLSSNNVMPNIRILNSLINKIDKVKDVNELILKLTVICDRLKHSIKILDIHDEFFYKFLHRIQEQLYYGFNNITINNFYLEMFKDKDIKGLDSKKLEQDINLINLIFHHPEGSSIIYDANGEGVNLNFNTKKIFADQINSNKENCDYYGSGIRKNILKFVPGPIGMASNNYYNFSYAIENKTLYNLICESYQKGEYVMTLLYHSTGGSIFYKPSPNLMNEKDYKKYSEYNNFLAEIYSEKTNYEMNEDVSDNCYGDLLRSIFPGVMLIELSKMGGNPIGPYGDVNNIKNVMTDNMEAFKNILRELNNDKITLKKIMK